MPGFEAIQPGAGRKNAFRSSGNARYIPAHEGSQQCRRGNAEDPAGRCEGRWIMQDSISMSLEGDYSAGGPGPPEEARLFSRENGWIPDGKKAFDHRFSTTI
jgi:hypothetical protein